MLNLKVMSIKNLRNVVTFMNRHTRDMLDIKNANDILRNAERMMVEKGYEKDFTVSKLKKQGLMDYVESIEDSYIELGFHQEYEDMMITLEAVCRM